MARLLSYRTIDNQGNPVSGCPVIVMTRNPLPIPSTTPPLVGRYVLGSTMTGADGTWTFEVDVDGPLMAVAWDPARPDRRPIVIEPIMG